VKVAKIVDTTMPLPSLPSCEIQVNDEKGTLVNNLRFDIRTKDNDKYKYYIADYASLVYFLNKFDDTHRKEIHAFLSDHNFPFSYITIPNGKMDINDNPVEETTLYYNDAVEYQTGKFVLRNGGLFALGQETFDKFFNMVNDNLK